MPRGRYYSQNYDSLTVLVSGCELQLLLKESVSIIANVELVDLLLIIRAPVLILVTTEFVVRPAILSRCQKMVEVTVNISVIT